VGANTDICYVNTRRENVAMRRTSVLVVDDDADSREMLSRVLDLTGFDVLTASGGVEGLAQARRHHPAAIVMDLSMPDMEGIEATRQLRAEPELRGIPVIAHSARSGLEALGLFDSICVKPCPPDALLERVIEAIAPDASDDRTTLAELRGRAVVLREQAITLWSAFTRPSMHEPLVRLVTQIVEEIECLKRLRGDAVPPGVRAAVAALATRVAEFEFLLRLGGPDRDGELSSGRSCLGKHAQRP
jgi:two-component system, cell cycle response regulator DivK